MSEEHLKHKPKDIGDNARNRKVPIVMMILTALLVLFFYGSRQLQGQLSDSIFKFDFAIANIITMIGAAMLFIGWLSWLWFNSQWSSLFSRTVPIVAVLGSVAFLILFRPIFTGGMTVNRWVPRFWNARDLGEADGEIKTDFAKASEADFPQFLGPNRNGIIDNFSMPPDFLYKAERLYVQDVGQGWSGFVARNGFAITMEQRGEFECVVCYEIETGYVAWSHKYRRRHDDALGGIGPRATPALDGDRVYTQGANGMVVCLNATTGKEIWKQDLTEVLGIELTVATDRKGNEFQREQTDVAWGRSGSPLIVNDLVVVPGDGPLEGEQVSLIAFNKFDGKEVWRGGDDGIGYGSPSLYDLAGTKQIVIENAATVSGHDPATGQRLWSFDRPGHSDSDANTSQAALVGNNRLLLTKGYGMGGELIEIARTESGSFGAKSVWQNSRVLKTKLTSAIIRDGYAYALSDGILECVDLESGKRVWKKGRYGHGQVLLVGDTLVVHSERGALHFVKASADSFQELDKVDTVRGVCWNTFCVYDRYILVRSDIEMACFKVGDDQ